jgi:hypothetical protein
MVVRPLLIFSIIALSIACTNAAQAQGWPGYAGGPQHNAVSNVASQFPQKILWSTPVDLNPQNQFGVLNIHYGSPLVTEKNTVIVPVKTGAVQGFRVEAHKGSDGTLVWQLDSDYTLPPTFDWILPFQSVLTGGSVAMAGAGGTILVRSSPDKATGTVTRLAFYGIDNYNANPGAYANSVQIITPITSDSSGNLFFGFLAEYAPGGLQSGLARIGHDGSSTWVSAAQAAGDANMQKVAYNCAPAISSDGSKVYVAVNNVSGFADGAVGSLVALNSQTLATIAAVRLKDPANPGNDALFFDDATTSPTVGPDGDVYYGVLENPFPSTHDRGWMLHFDANLATSKTPGAFGWDITPSIVTAKAVPSYKGHSSYLILTKYNNYAELGGDGVNRLAVQDPNDTMIDPISGATVMKTIVTIIGPTPDQNLRDQGHPLAVREWCINTAVIDPHNKCAIVNSEDGNLYRWDFTSNSLTARINLSTGVGEPYTPTLVGPDGKIYGINNSILFACGSK